MTRNENPKTHRGDSTQNKSKREPNTEEVAVKVVALLKPLSSESRARVISAALTLLGETTEIKPHSPHDSRPSGHPGDADEKAGTDVGHFPPKATNWMKQNTLTAAQIGNVFDVEAESIPVIASHVPGSTKDMVHNAYVLCGVSRLLGTGDTAFSDDAAREVCKQLGCYDKNNHSSYVRQIGNLLSGTKKTGWRLTVPGLKRGADLVKQLTQE